MNRRESEARMNQLVEGAYAGSGRKSPLLSMKKLYQ